MARFLLESNRNYLQDVSTERRTPKRLCSNRRDLSLLIPERILAAIAVHFFSSEHNQERSSKNPARGNARHGRKHGIPPNRVHAIFRDFLQYAVNKYVTYELVHFDPLNKALTSNRFLTDPQNKRLTYCSSETRVATSRSRSAQVAAPTTPGSGDPAQDSTGHTTLASLD
jgi:hypothetical protein